MPYELIWEPDGLYKRFRGRVTAKEFRASVSDALADSRFLAARYTINDLLGVIDPNTDGLDFGEIIDFEVNGYLKNRNLKVAIVTTDQGVIKFLEQYAKVPVALSSPKIFPDVSLARQWALALREQP